MANLISMTTTLSVEQKIRAKNAAHKIKCGSPKLRDLLREKCRSRIKESRLQSFNRIRISDNDFMTKIVKEEIQELDDDIELQERIYEEIRDEISQWTVEEFERENNYLFNDRPTFFCPFCKKGELNTTTNSADQVTCNKCNIQFKCLGTPDQFHELIQRKIVQHELLCDENLDFFIEPISSTSHIQGLNAICMQCDFYSKLY